MNESVSERTHRSCAYLLSYSEVSECAKVKNLPTQFSSAALSLAGEHTVMSCLQPLTGAVCSGHNISIAQISLERPSSLLTLSHRRLPPVRTLLLRGNQQSRAIPAVPSPPTATSVQRGTLHQERERILQKSQKTTAGLKGAHWRGGPCLQGLAWAVLQADSAGLYLEQGPPCL